MEIMEELAFVLLSEPHPHVSVALAHLLFMEAEVMLLQLSQAAPQMLMVFLPLQIHMEQVGEAVLTAAAHFLGEMAQKALYTSLNTFLNL
jgi:hypothetical protein